MHPSTKKEVDELKLKIQHVIYDIWMDKFNFHKYIDLKLITTEQRVVIQKNIKDDYPNISFEPILVALRPLVDIARHIIKEQRTIPSRFSLSNKRTAPPLYYLEDEAFYSRQRDFIDYDYDDGNY